MSRKKVKAQSIAIGIIIFLFVVLAYLWVFPKFIPFYPEKIENFEYLVKNIKKEVYSFIMSNKYFGLSEIFYVDVSSDFSTHFVMLPYEDKKIVSLDQIPYIFFNKVLIFVSGNGTFTFGIYNNSFFNTLTSLSLSKSKESSLYFSDYLFFNNTLYKKSGIDYVELFKIQDFLEDMKCFDKDFFGMCISHLNASGIIKNRFSIASFDSLFFFYHMYSNDTTYYSSIDINFSSISNHSFNGNWIKIESSNNFTIFAYVFPNGDNLCEVKNETLSCFIYLNETNNYDFIFFIVIYPYDKIQETLSIRDFTEIEDKIDFLEDMIKNIGARFNYIFDIEVSPGEGGYILLDNLKASYITLNSKAITNIDTPQTLKFSDSFIDFSYSFTNINSELNCTFYPSNTTLYVYGFDDTVLYINGSDIHVKDKSTGEIHSDTSSLTLNITSGFHEYNLYANNITYIKIDKGIFSIYLNNLTKFEGICHMGLYSNRDIKIEGKNTYLILSDGQNIIYNDLLNENITHKFKDKGFIFFDGELSISNAFVYPNNLLTDRFLEVPILCSYFNIRNQNALKQVEKSESYDFWWNKNWKYRRKIKINSFLIEDKVEDFILKIELNDSNFNFSHAKEDGTDIRFIYMNKILPYEIEYWNSSEKKAIIWVKMDEIDPRKDQYLWLYYGNPNAQDIQKPGKVWQDYLGVWHMNLIGNSVLDSSPHKNNGTAYDVELCKGLLGYSTKFNGSSSYIDFGNDSIFNITGNVTVELLIKPVIYGQHGLITTTSSYGGGLALYLREEPNNMVAFWINENGLRKTIVVGNISNQSWVYMAGVYDGKYMYIYLNGEELFEKPLIGTETYSFDKLILGYISWIDNPKYFDGIVDEMRITNKPLSKYYFQAVKENLFGNLIDILEEEELNYTNDKITINLDTYRVYYKQNYIGDFPLIKIDNSSITTIQIVYEDENMIKYKVTYDNNKEIFVILFSNRPIIILDNVSGNIETNLSIDSTIYRIGLNYNGSGDNAPDVKDIVPFSNNFAIFGLTDKNTVISFYLPLFSIKEYYINKTSKQISFDIPSNTRIYVFISNWDDIEGWELHENFGNNIREFLTNKGIEVKIVLPKIVVYGNLTIS